MTIDEIIEADKQMTDEEKADYAVKYQKYVQEKEYENMKAAVTKKRETED